MFVTFFRRRKFKKQLKELINGVTYRLDCDDDILDAKTKSALQDVRAELKKYAARPSLSDQAAVNACENRLEPLMPKNDLPRKIRNFLDVLVVACTVAGGIRALYIQPFRIPTSSMQPTLFGIHYVDREASRPFMGSLTRSLMPVQASKAQVKVRSDGMVSTQYRMRSSNIISTVSDFKIGPETYTVPGDYLSQVLRYLPRPQPFYQAGDTFCDGWLSTGDHVFVERFSLFFRPFKRGDVIVFNTENISSPTQPLGGFYYIKRLVGLPGDTLQISDNILMIRPKGEKEFRPAWEFSDAFKKVYSLKGGYQGHKADGLLSLGGELTVPEGYFFALGDNTNFSLDGRNWGFIPRRNMVGLAVMIFWPVSRRWGIVDTKPPLETPTVMPAEPFFQPSAMCMQ
ncbi:MAG: signal peptidase I [Lentisphaerae bacterium]|nr:signal peptidase I [Lentisphaerota bacterium]